MSMDEGLGFRGKDGLVKSLAEKHRKRHGLHMRDPSTGAKNLLLLV
jgi:hypothetical protein